MSHLCPFIFIFYIFLFPCSLIGFFLRRSPSHYLLILAGPLLRWVFHRLSKCTHHFCDVIKSTPRGGANKTIGFQKVQTADESNHTAFPASVEVDRYNESWMRKLGACWMGVKIRHWRWRTRCRGGGSYSNMAAKNWQGIIILREKVSSRLRVRLYPLYGVRY